MAEIKIEKKRQIWPWLFLVLVIFIVALLIYFLVFRDNLKNSKEVTEADYITKTEADYITKTNESDLIMVKEKNVTVAAYVNFIENSIKKMSLSHEFTNEALLKLTDATKDMAEEVGYEIQADLEKVKEYANMITVDPYVTTHAGYIRNAVDILTDVLQNIQKAKYPSLADEVEELKSAAESINPKVLTLQQKDAVKNYFAKASELLKKMN